MNDQEDRYVADLKKTNDELREGLEQCHHLVADLRQKLAANGNQVDGHEDGEDEVG